MFATHAKNRSALKSLRVRAANTTHKARRWSGKWEGREDGGMLSNNVANASLPTQIARRQRRTEKDEDEDEGRDEDESSNESRARQFK